MRGPYGHLTGPARKSSMFFISLWTRKGIHTTRIGKTLRTGVVFGRTEPVRAPQGLFTGCLQSLNPHGARKLIMHALKLYGPRTGKQNSYGAARGPCEPREWTYDFCSKQPGNSPYGARECDVTEASSLGHILQLTIHCLFRIKLQRLT